MRIPDEIRSCVCFVYRKKSGRLLPAGTAVILFEDIDGLDRRWVFFATAKHVINAIAADSDDDIAHLRFNVVDGGIDWLTAPVDKWRFDDIDLASDVAVFHGALPVDYMQYMLFPVDRLATADVLKAQQIGVGDEVAIPGLFSMHVPEDRNIPIVRIGNIAAMPEGRLPTRLGPMEAYLIEARSIGGVSGAPVFVNVGMDRSDGLGNLLLKGSVLAHELFLLGIVHGHFDAPGDLPGGVEAARDELTTRHPVNVGIAVVTPAQKILDIWNTGEDFERRKLAAELVRAGQLTDQDLSP